MHRPAALALVAPLLCASPGALAQPLGLADAVARIVERGPEQAAIAAQVAVARADATTARMLSNPSLTLLGASIEPVASAGLAVRLPYLGQWQAEVHAAEARVAEAGSAARFGRWRLRRAARLAYFEVALADEQLTIARDAGQLAERVAEVARQRLAAGAGTRLDEQQGALARVRALWEVSDRAAAAEVARFELARLLGAPPDEALVLADSLGMAGPVPSVAELLDGASREQPELAALVAERESARARGAAARSARVPVPTLEVGADLLNVGSCSSPGRCVAPRGSLSFDLPVLNLNGGPVARAEAEQRLAEMRLVAARARVEAALRAAHRRWRAALARVRFFDGGYVAAAEAVVEMAREGFAAGRTGLLPLIEARRAVLEARVGRAAALFDEQVARADIEEASGVALSLP